MLGVVFGQSALPSRRVLLGGLSVRPSSSMTRSGLRTSGGGSSTSSPSGSGRGTESSGMRSAMKAVDGYGALTPPRRLSNYISHATGNGRMMKGDVPVWRMHKLNAKPSRIIPPLAMTERARRSLHANSEAVKSQGVVQSEEYKSFNSQGGKRTRVSDIFSDKGKQEDWIGRQVVLKGWIRTLRAQKKLAFMELNDGSSFNGIQIVLDSESLVGGESKFSEVVSDVSTGAAVAVMGQIVKSPAKGQSLEIKCEDIKVVGIVYDNDKYPLQKKRHSLEFLRSIAHLRARTNTFAAVARVRSSLALGVHNYFHDLGFKHLHSPIITASDCEGAGEMFRVTTLDVAGLSQGSGGSSDLRGAGDDHDTDAAANLFKQDFFEKPAFLTVSGQLSGETYATALGDIYTFGPTFRAENSQTSRHLAEFWMIEPEMAFADIHDAMDNCEGMVRQVATVAMSECPDDLNFFSKFYEKQLKQRLDLISNKPFKRLQYSDAVKLLQEEIAKDRSVWEYPDVEFGTDLQTEHERWICEKWADGAATFVYNYPRDIKAFYMRDNDDGKTVAAFDLLVPGVGELAGGSQREERLEVLRKKLKEFNLNEDDYWWYMDLRRYGSVPHSGYGVGFERLVCYLTGMANVRDVIPYPRYPGNAEF